MSIAPCGVRTLVHPGPVAEQRVVCVPARLTAHDVVLPAGVPLLQAIASLLAKTGGRSATGELVGGELAAFSYYIPDVGPKDGPVATFSAPRAGGAPARLVRGGITIGHKNGAVFVHCHALFVDSVGVERAGHLIPESVLLGSGVRARVWASADVAIEVSLDLETKMPLFAPRQVSKSEAGDVAAVICRVRPNVDLIEVIEMLTEQQGWAGADVRGQIGSLVGGQLKQEDGTVVVVDGPATEVISLAGAVRRTRERMTAMLDAYLVDRHAVVHSGRLLRGQNAVALTYELVLTEAVEECS